MPLPELINEPILVQARFHPDGQVQPTAFIWRNRTRYVADLGRRWTEEEGGVAWRCFLLRTPTAETFELRLNWTTGQWVLSRAWLNSPAA